MKKLMTALAVCTVAGFAVAQTVTSANVVGYNTVTLNQGFTMLAVNLDNVAAPADGIDINTLIPGSVSTNLLRGATGTAADNIMVFNSGSQSYNIYYLYYATKGTTTYNNQWVVNASTLATNKFKSGDTFWYNKRTAIPVTIQFAGQVPNDASKTRAIVNGYNMIGSGYAADWDPNSLGTTYWSTNGAFRSGTGSSADNIMVYNNGSQSYAIYYLYYATKGTTTYNNQWVLNATTKAPTNFVTLGSAVWYNHRGTGFTLPQSVPYSL